MNHWITRVCKQISSCKVNVFLPKVTRVTVHTLLTMFRRPGCSKVFTIVLKKFGYTDWCSALGKSNHIKSSFRNDFLILHLLKKKSIFYLEFFNVWENYKKKKYKIEFKSDDFLGAYMGCKLGDIMLVPGCIGTTS